MKKNYLHIILLSVSVLFFACGENELKDSYLKEPVISTEELDVWIDETFREPYNIRVQYKWVEADTDHSKDLVPPKMNLVQPFLKAVDKIWIRPYVEVADEKETFFKKNTCRELKLIGSGSWNIGSVTLGLAEGGFKITLYTVNSFDLEKGVSKENLRQFFRTMHHEFGHILNQRKKYDPQFKQITGGYVGDWTSRTDKQARELGFISAYSMSGDGEDFVEILSYYICYTEQEWNDLLGAIDSEESVKNIKQKVLSVDLYMKESYGVDIDKLRVAIMAQMDNVVNGNLD